MRWVPGARESTVTWSRTPVLVEIDFVVLSGVLGQHQLACHRRGVGRTAEDVTADQAARSLPDLARHDGDRLRRAPS